MGMLGNLSGLFSDARARTIILLTGGMLVVAIGVGYFTLERAQRGVETKATVTGVPGGIRSIPGSVDPTAQYAKLQERQNIAQAKLAKRRGTSAIPTIIRTEKLGEGQRVSIGVPEGEGGVGFRTLARSQLGGTQKDLWLQQLQNGKCSQAIIQKIRAQGAGPEVFKEAGCDPKALEQAGFSLAQLRQAGYTAKQLRDAGYNASQLKAAGYNAKQLRDAGFSACELKAAGFTAKELLAAGYSPEELKGAGFSPEEIQQAGGAAIGSSPAAIKAAGCDINMLRKERAAGVSAAAIRKAAGCSASALKKAGFTDTELAQAGFTPAQIQEANADAALPDGVSVASLRAGGCSVAGLRRARIAGATAKQIREVLGCSARQMRDAGYSASELAKAGFTAGQLKDAGFTASQLKNAGFTAAQLKGAGFTSAQMKAAGYSNAELQNAGVITAPEAAARDATLKAKAAGITDTQLQAVLARQAQTMTRQKLDQEIQQRTAAMTGEAGKLVNAWQPSAQVFVQGTLKDTVPGGQKSKRGAGSQAGAKVGPNGQPVPQGPAAIKAGKIMFAVMDTSVNSDEPGPILATVIQGPYKGAKLIGSFTRPDNAKKLVVTFNTMSMKQLPRSIPINAVAINPNTARTALASKVNSHYLLRYGSLLASSFLEGFGGAFAASGTSVQIGGTETAFFRADQASRSAGENAIIALAKVGQRAGTAMAPLFNKPPTIKIYSGVGVGVLFTQDVSVPTAAQLSN
jgi:intracellular multiplication protein IcmE